MKTSFNFAVIAAIAIGVLSSAASATVSSFPPSDDSMIFANGTTKHDTGNGAGSGPGLFAGADGSSNIKRSLLRFDIHTVTTTATQVELDLWIGQIAGTGGGSGSGTGCDMGCTYPTRDFALYPSTTGWHEGHIGNEACSGSPCGTFAGTGQGWSYTTCSPSSSSPCTGGVTWLYYDYTGTSGVDEWMAEPTDQDYGYGTQGTAMATMTVSAPFFVGDMESFIGNASTNPDFLAEVNTWIATPADNLGMELRSTNLEGSATSFLGFWSKDGAAAAPNSLAPVLTITY